MYKYITLAMVLSATSYSSFGDSIDIDNIPISILPQCSVMVTVGDNGLTGFELDDSNYSTIKVEVDTTGDILMTTVLDLANSWVGDDADMLVGHANSKALNKEPILWSLKIDESINNGDPVIISGDVADVTTGRAHASTGIFIQTEDNGALAEVNNTVPGNADYYSHEVRMLRGTDLSAAPLRNISNALNVEASSNKGTGTLADLDNLLITTAGDAADDANGVLVDATDKWKTAVRNLEARELISSNSKLEFNYEFGYHFPMGAVGTEAGDVINLVIKTTVLDQ